MSKPPGFFFIVVRLSVYISIEEIIEKNKAININNSLFVNNFRF